MKPFNKFLLFLAVTLFLGVWIWFGNRSREAADNEPIEAVSPLVGGRVFDDEDESALPDRELQGEARVDADLREWISEISPVDHETALQEEVWIPGLTAPAGVRPDGSVITASPLDDQIWLEADGIAVDSGPEAELHAVGMLVQRPEVALVGAALLLNQPDWSDEMIDRIASHHPAVSLFAMQGLQDQGRGLESAIVAERIRGRLGSVTDWEALLSEVTFPGTSIRGLVELSREWAEEDRRVAMLDSVLGRAEIDYGGRMRALLEYENMIGFVDYRERVYDELKQAGSQRVDPIWNLGLELLAERLEGPVEVLSEPRIVTTVDLDVLMAREHPAMFEDMALYLEQSLRRGDSMFQSGLADHLNELIERQLRLPMSPSEQEALRRMAALAEALPEDDIGELNALFPPLN